MHRPGPLIVLVLAPACHPLFAQSPTHWVVPTTLGYGALGCGAGYVAVTEAIRQAEDRGEFEKPAKDLGVAAGCFLGFKGAYGLGSEADSLLAEGEPLPTGQRRGVQLGTVLTGAALRFRSLNPLGARSAWGSRRPRGGPGRCR